MLGAAATKRVVPKGRLRSLDFGSRSALPSGTIESQGRKQQFTLPKLPLGSWVDFICRARYWPGPDRRFELWMNGQRTASYSGPLADPGSKNSFYHKIGLYRDCCKDPMTIFFDNYAMGNSYEEVDPARFEKNTQAGR
jgi:hypothetical protein